MFYNSVTYFLDIYFLNYYYINCKNLYFDILRSLIGILEFYDLVVILV